MINEITDSNINNIIDLVRDRKINFITIKKQIDKYYVEYKKGENNSDKMIDLVYELEYFKEYILNNPLSNFYLYYNVEVDKIISNYQTINSKENNIISAINKVKNLKDDIENIKDEKIVIQIDKRKKCQLTYDKLINTLLSGLMEKL